MKKAIIVEFNLMTRIVIEESEENEETIVNKSIPNILEKIKNGELHDNLVSWKDDLEMPYQENREQK